MKRMQEAEYGFNFGVNYLFCCISIGEVWCVLMVQ